MGPSVRVTLGLSKLKHYIYKKRNVGVSSPDGVWLQAFCWEIFGEVIKASMKRWYTTAGNPSNVNIYMSRWRDEKPFQSRLLFFGIFFQRWYFLHGALRFACEGGTRRKNPEIELWLPSRLSDQETRELRHGFITRLRFWYVARGIKSHHPPH